MRSSFRAFMQFIPPQSPYYWGQHTIAIADMLQRASDGLLAGRSTRSIVIVPPRHGKSDLASRRFPVWHLCRAPHHEIILTSYSGNLATDMSHAARRCFIEVAPMFGTGLDESRGQVAAWQTTRGGGLKAVGLGGSITGRGADILIVDDYLKNREEAESEIIREKIWDSYRNDLLTRLAPVHAIIIPCTRWHEDDLVGRILRASAEDPDFPSYEVIRYPAQSDDGSWLFPERFSDTYYREHKSEVGSYGWQALYQGNPEPRHGNMLRADLAVVHDEAPGGLRWARGWDLASTEKQRAKDDPDFTAGVKIAMPNGELWVSDVVRGQWSVGARNKRIVAAARGDGPNTIVGIEAVAGYKDTARQIKDELAGVAVVRESHPDKDKVARASVLEPLFEAGKIHLVRGAWNEAFLSECRSFPRGRHDDQVDALVVAYEQLRRAHVRIGGL